MGTSIKSKKGLDVLKVPKPEGVITTLEDKVLVVKGPLGEVKKDFFKAKVEMIDHENEIELRPLGTKRADAAILNTIRSLVRNIFIGVTEGYRYALKIVYAHFPITVSVKGSEIHVENFLGERSSRVAKILGDTKINVEGDDVVVTGISREDVGQTSANIETATKIKRKDQRVFLDGLYVYEKTKAN